MPKIAYQSFNFHSKSLDLIGKCNEIIAEYTAEGYQLTLRQLYYQLVSRDYIPNNQKSYDRVGSLVNDARLAGVIERPCTLLDVGYFSCRGYVSQSEMWGAAQRFIARARAGQKTVVIHLGDHDPSGIDMSRDIEERIKGFMGHHGWRSHFEIQRIALNMNQVEEYQPPPNPAKSTDSRFADYLNKYGDESWELDALEPRILAELITDAVNELREEEPFNKIREREQIERSLLARCSEQWRNIAARLEEED